MKKAIIYVRGHNKEAQELHCKLCAAEQGYNVLFATDDLKKVKGCDILLISNRSRISRNQIKYYETVNEFRAAGIEVESVAHHDNSSDYYFFSKMLSK